MRKRLSPEEATFLGLEVRPNEEDRLKARYYISNEQWQKILDRKELENKVESKTDSNDYKKKNHFLTAFDGNGGILSIEKYCVKYNLDFNKISSYKFISHAGFPAYNIVFREEIIIEDIINIEELKSTIQNELLKFKRKPLINLHLKENIGSVHIADLHLGAFVANLIRTKDFSIAILIDKLLDAVDLINAHNFSKVHIYILGDLIESFTGLSHKNTWKGLDNKVVGAEAVKMVVKVLHENFLSKILNLGEVKIVAGNHDRVTSDNKEDVQGDAANLVAWGLSLIGYKVEFNALVITHTIDKITYILQHGHHSVSKKPLNDICWSYGVQGNYNFVVKAHLHSLMMKEKIKVIKKDILVDTVLGDSVDQREVVCPSFFTGNFYSEGIGFTSQSGFLITEDNGKGIPHMHTYAV